MNLYIAKQEELEELVKTSVDKALVRFFKQKENETKKSKNLSVKEAAALLKVSDITIRNYIKRGLIKADRLGARIIINREALENTLKEVKSLKYKR